jgi:hypothetical protein
MTYITRHLIVKDLLGKETVYSDADFLRLEGPLVILGEPGAGKSEVVGQLTSIPSTIFYRASTLTASPSITPENEQGKIVVDGLDEVTAYGKGTAIVEILSKIDCDRIDQFVFTCRAIDWQSEANTAIILDRWKKRPVVGILRPLTDLEIVDFVDRNGEGLRGKTFLRLASSHAASDLLRNPQTLVMMMRVVKKYGWPATRKELYSKTCAILIEESNSFHLSAHRSRPSYEGLLDAAGFICAHLLLSNNSVINLERAPGESTYTIGDYVTADYSYDILKDALSSMVFRTVGGTAVEPCHRTVAEYLGAIWLSTNLNNKLSLRRLETLLYAENYHVAPALRGLHAWIACVASSEIQTIFISRDPYGVLRYGDPTDFLIPQSRVLLVALEKLADTDPYFRNGDWHSTYARALNKPELKPEILEIFKNRNAFHLTHLILESIRGGELADAITEDLVGILSNNKFTYIEREAALNVLKESNSQPLWENLVKKLIVLSDMDSLRLGLRIIELFPPSFQSQTIAELLISISKNNGRPDRLSGIGFNLSKALSSVQLLQTLSLLMEFDLKTNTPESLYPEQWIFSFTYELFLRNHQPTDVRLLYRLLDRINHYNDHQRQKFNAVVSDHFLKNENIRHKIQDIVFDDHKPGELWLAIHDLNRASSGLSLQDNDVLRRLKIIAEGGNQFPNREQHWKQLAHFVLVHKTGFENSVALVDQQVLAYPELFALYDELLQPQPDPDSEHHTREQRQWEEEKKQATLARHKSYEGVVDQLKNGTHLEAISYISKAYLGGWLNDIEGDTPRGRVESLVGTRTTDVALQSISTLIETTQIPSAREIIELRAKENKEYLIEPILLAYYSIISNNLTNEPIKRLASALAVCRWGVHFHADEITPDLQTDLEQRIFAVETDKAQFIRDTIEPYVEVCTDHIAGLSRLYDDDVFASIAGGISIEWLSKYSNFSDATLNDLLKTAINLSSLPDLLRITHQKIESESWKNEEQRGMWMSVLFLVEFDKNVDKLTSFVKEDIRHFWSIKHASQQFWQRKSLSRRQNHFIIKTFAPEISYETIPPSGFAGRDHPWEGRQFILDRLAALSTDISDDAINLMQDLDRQKLKGYDNDVKHALSEQRSLRAAQLMKTIGWSDVRAVLVNSTPLNHADLQSLVLDQLEMLQRRLKNSPTNDYVTFWKDSTPHSENYCRDRVVAHLVPYLEKFTIRCYTEGTMPENQRCDFLNSLNLIDLPVEVKGQWHPDLWTSAYSQLETYSKMYRANGYGIYLVLWFGPTKEKGPQKFGNVKIETYREMLTFLETTYSDKLSTRTKLFVLDLSRPLAR